MATTSESHMLSSSSFSSSSSKSYEVFLSFYGKDTRGNFTDHLYNGLVRAGIRTFRDNEEVRHGDEIGPVLMKAIQESKISIPVFSENYAFSKWCLKELAEIMECKKNDGQIVWPIFYKVDPSHIRNQIGNFAEAFLQHQENQAKETVDSWRNALKDAGNLKGWDSQSPENSYESDLIRSVVVDVLRELKKTIALDVGNHLIGMDSRVDDVIRLLDLESEDVQYVGICGMGGIGKSTIAKAVFNKISCHFKGDSKGWSFLEDISSTSQHVEGLVKLQNALVYGILGYNLNFHSVSEGINIIMERCRNKKVLIILDDVNRDEQLRALAGHPNWFGSGSRIIITTRDKHILQVKQVEETKIYMPKVLNDNQSLQLFCNHAFGKDQPSKKFMLLSRNVVEIVGGLPLAIEVLGSFLYGESCHDVWESMVDSLKKIPYDDIQKKLQISYDRLNASEKDTFLDIACFFIGMDKEIVIHILEDFSPEKNIKVLVRKSLVSIGDDNMLRMHDLLRDMGREIVRQESPKNAEKRTRLWSHDETLDVLKKCKGTSSIQGLSLVFRLALYHIPALFKYQRTEKYSRLKIEAFKPMLDLRLLQVDGAYFDGDFDALSTELKWLSWKGIPSECIPSISHLTKLSVLDLSESWITDDWNGWQHIQKFKTLKVLDLRGCHLLTRTPDFSDNTRLQRLILDRCLSLIACDESIGCLKKLVYLTLKRCVNIKKLPDSICKLSSLTNLILSDCGKLEKLPKALGDMKSLTELIIDDTDIEELPDSIGSLEKLVRLSAEGCSKLARIPRSMGKLRRLQYINLLRSCINELPEGFGNLWSLKELKMGSSTLFPSRFPTLKGRREFQSIRKLPLIFFELNAMLCVSRESLPNLSNFKSLERVHVYHCEKLTEIEGLNDLSLLQELDLTNCKMLQSLPELPSSLIRLNIRDCSSVESLPNLSNLKKLEEIHLRNCEKLTEIEDLKFLALLKKLNLQNCVMLQSLPELPPSLISIDISYCRSMESLPNLSNLKILKQLCLSHCGKLAKIEGMGGLSLLKYLNLRNCIMLQSLPELPPSLTKLQVWWCMKLSEIEGIIRLSLLKVLHLYDCRELRSLPDLSNLKKLVELLLERCDNLVEIRGLESLESLKYFRVCRCNTYIKTLQNCVAQGMLVGAFHGGNINKIYWIPDSDENIKGMALLLVYQTPIQLLRKPIHLEVEAVIMRNDGERIRCCHDLQIEGMTGTDVDGYYSCYFHGLTWFGLPLRKQYVIQVTQLGEPHQVVDELSIYGTEGSHLEANKVRIKMFAIVPEYETIEDSQELEKRIAPLITCTSVESEGVGRGKKPDDDADPSTCSQQRGVQRGNKRKWEHDDDDYDAGPINWLALWGGEGQGPISCSQQREGVQRGNKRKWEHDDDDDGNDDDWLALW